MRVFCVYIVSTYKFEECIERSGSKDHQSFLCGGHTILVSKQRSLHSLASSVEREREREPSLFNRVHFFSIINEIFFVSFVRRQTLWEHIYGVINLCI